MTDDDPTWRPTQFSQELFDCRVSLDFPTVKLLDYQDRLDELALNPNPFAIVVMAHLQTQATRRKSAERYEAKLAVAQLLYRRGYKRREILELFRFIDWVMTLPPGLENQFKIDIAQFEAEANMRYVTSIERLAKAEGILEKAQESVTDALEIRFGFVPDSIISLLKKVEDAEILRQLLRLAITAESLAAFEQQLKEIAQVEPA